MQYRKKPVVIEAFQYDGDLKNRNGKYYVPDWAVKAFEEGIMYYIIPRTKPDDTPELYIKTLKGDHVIQGVNGELYPCKPDIFEKTYEKVEE